MAKFTFVGIEDLIVQYQEMEIQTEEMIKRAIYNGVDVVADGIRESLNNVVADDASHKNGRRSSITSKQKQGLLDSLGVTPIKNDHGIINAKIGFSGYNDVKTKKYPKGQPNPLIARALESGTSFMNPNPVINRTARKLKKKCEQAMQESLDRDYKAIEK